MRQGDFILNAKNFIRTIVIVSAITGMAGIAIAAESLRSPSLQQFEAAGGTVDFIGSSHGLDGWVLKDPDGKVKQTVYTTQDGALIAGMLFSSEGDNETKTQLEAYHARTAKGAQEAAPGADKSSSKAEKLYAEVEKAAWVGLGNPKAPYLYVFMNVTCDHCQAFWKDLESAVKGGSIQVRFVPYGKTDENRDGGAALLSAADPEAAWEAFVGGDKSALGKDKIKDDAYAKIDANTNLINTWKVGGPPFTLYRRPGDGILTAVVGRPENPMLLMAEFIKGG
jgi:hypothetical protein